VVKNKVVTKINKLIFVQTESRHVMFIFQLEKCNVPTYQVWISCSVYVTRGIGWLLRTRNKSVRSKCRRKKHM